MKSEEDSEAALSQNESVSPDLVGSTSTIWLQLAAVDQWAVPPVASTCTADPCFVVLKSAAQPQESDDSRAISRIMRIFSLQITRIAKSKMTCY